MTSSTSSKPTLAPDPIFDSHVKVLQDRLDNFLHHYGPLLFTTDASGLWEAYLQAFPEENRQHFNCHTCRRFIEAYGGLVAITPEGDFASPFWGLDAPSFYAEPTRALMNKVLAARVNGVFYSKTIRLGTPEAGGWTHLAVAVPPTYTGLHKVTLTSGQARAEKREDYANVMRTLAEYSADDLAQAVRVLQSETLYRSEKLLGAAEWLAGLQQIRLEVKNHHTREALLWRAVGLAPSGFCHPRSGMLGTLLDDIRDRYPFGDIKRRFDAKMNPLVYQRPQVLPAAGAIAQAEKLVEQLGIAQSLQRRFARLDEIEPLWMPAEPKAAPERPGVFGHLVPKGEQPAATLEIPAVTMTWEKFQRVVLPAAEAIEFLVPSHNENYTALTTAAHADAPPILQWDNLEYRNPVAWYVYMGGSKPEAFGLKGNTWTKVTAVAHQPTEWGPKDRPRITHQGESVIFFLEGCRDMVNRGGLELFPECLRSELHQVRSVLEAYSRAGRIQDTDGPNACGLRLQKGNSLMGRFRITSKGSKAVYIIDRWD